MRGTPALASAIPRLPRAAVSPVPAAGGLADQQRDLALDGSRAASRPRTSADRAAQKLLVHLGQLARHHHGPAAQHRLTASSVSRDAMRRLVENQRGVSRRAVLPALSCAAPAWAAESRRSETHPWAVPRPPARPAPPRPGSDHRDARFHRRRTSRYPGSETSGVPASDTSATDSPPAASRTIPRALRLVVLVIADQRLANIIMVQQLSRLPRIFARNHDPLRQHAHRA